MPQSYVFKLKLGIDVNYFTDADGDTYRLFNMVELGTSFPIEAVLRRRRGTQESAHCLDVVMQHWVSWAGYPKEISADSGLNNRGVFCKELSAAECIAETLDWKHLLSMVRCNDSETTGRRQLQE